MRSFFRKSNGTPWKASHQLRPMAEASAAAGLSPPATFHILRHTHGSALAMAGVRTTPPAQSSARPSWPIALARQTGVKQNVCATSMPTSFNAIGPSVTQTKL